MVGGVVAGRRPAPAAGPRRSVAGLGFGPAVKRWGSGGLGVGPAVHREGSVMHGLEEGGWAALDRNTMMCRIYEVRPLICGEFEMGEPDCVDERDKWFITLA